MSKILLSIAVATTAAFASPVQAQPAETRQVLVFFADLDLTTGSGVARLDRRIAAAANQACGSANGRDQPEIRSVRQCRALALASVAADREAVILAARRGEVILTASLQVR